MEKTFWTAAHEKTKSAIDGSTGPQNLNFLRRFYQKKRRRGLHELSAVTARALKVTRVVWRDRTDQRDYLSKAPTTTTHS